MPFILPLPFLQPLTIIRFKIGEIFVSLQTEEAQEYLEEMKVKIGDDIKEINGKMDDVKKSMDTLKVDLYAKFGSNINLEAE